MAEPVKKDDALAAAVREAFQRHMENARLASQVKKPTPLASDPRLQPHRLITAVAELEKPPEAKQPATPSEASSAGSGWVGEVDRRGEEGEPEQGNHSSRF